MKIKSRNLRFVANSTETLDFKAFCEGGSPEYVKAKQNLKNSYRKQQENSRSSMRRKQNSVRPSFPVYSLYINPFAFLDINFLIAAGCVVLIAVLEKKLAENGIIEPAAILSGVLKIGFPLVAFGSILILISKLGVFL